eukprot:scaffold2998_cov390-Prasinococcus_capsulatus_cf.AAC.6
MVANRDERRARFLLKQCAAGAYRHISTCVNVDAVNVHEKVVLAALAVDNEAAEDLYVVRSEAFVDHHMLQCHAGKDGVSTPWSTSGASTAHGHATLFMVSRGSR